MNFNNEKLQLARNFIELTGDNVFLTGKAGTGKTTFLQELRKITYKRTVVVAPTGVAAINAGGVTIHSFFQLPFGPLVPGRTNQISGNDGKPSFKNRFSKEKINIILTLDLLIIDEISMVRADLLDAIDEVLRRYRDRNKPFGGVQLLMIGDLQQLSPVVKQDEWEILNDLYETAFFFGSRALQKTRYITIILEHVYRQSDQEFIHLLNKARENEIDEESLEKLNTRYTEGFSHDHPEGYIILTTHNAKAQNINNAKLRALPSEEITFKGNVEGEFPEYAYPTDFELSVKEGAQVMFVKNDPSPEKLFYNGKIGVIREIDKEEGLIFVFCEEENELIDVSPLEWQNMKFTIDRETKEIEETVIGTYRQFPLKLAWAITIHKSQGLTFEKAIIDGRAAFAHGQIYVALSRCRTLDGLILSEPLNSNCFINNREVFSFTKSAEENPPDEQQLKKAKIIYEKSLIKDLFTFSEFHYPLNQAIKNAELNASAIINEIEKYLKEIKEKANKDVFQISDKFLHQINELTSQDIEINSNKALQERIIKASEYFKEKLLDIFFHPLINLTVETDNKEVQKVINKHLDKLLKEVSVKVACMKSCQTGFDTAEYLKARTNAWLAPPVKRKKKEKTASELKEESKHQKLYNELINWRNKKAGEDDLPHYMILQLKAVANISNDLPASLKELNNVKGIGKKKVEQYGKELLQLIGKYCDQNNIPFEEKDEIPETANRKKNKKRSKDISFELFKEGKSILEIAEEREYSVSTIEGHLTAKVIDGDLAAEELLEKEKMDRIIEYFQNSKDRLLTPAKESLGEDYSYLELRIVKYHLDNLENR